MLAVYSNYQFARKKSDFTTAEAFAWCVQFAEEFIGTMIAKLVLRLILPRRCLSIVSGIEDRGIR